MGGRIYLSPPPTSLDAYSQNALELPCWVMPLLSPGFSSPLRLDKNAEPTTDRLCQATPCGANDLWWFRNINRMSIAYDFRPRLRPD